VIPFKRRRRYPESAAAAAILGATSAADFEVSQSEHLSIADNASLSTGAIDFSFTLWFKPESDANNQDLLAKYKTAGNNYEYLLHYVATGGNEQVYWYVSNDGSNRGIVPSVTKLVVGTYSMIYAYHENGVNMGISIDDGSVEVDAPPFTLGGYDSAANFVLGGRDPYNATYGADGLMAAVGFWKRKLTASEVTSLYNSGSGKQYADLTDGEKVGLESYWNLDESSGTRVDSHGTNDLTDNNTVLSGAGPGA
jgi:hypothetical protein